MSGVQLAAVILAAGASRRFGSPKALAVWRGKTFVEHAIALASDVGCGPVVVEGAVPLWAVVGSTAALVHHPGWEAGPLSSLQAGIRAQRGGAFDGLLVLTVDRPHLAPVTLRDLCSAFAREPGAYWQPSVGGRPGHPVIYPRALALRLLELAPEGSARELLAAADVRPLRRTLPCSDAAVLENIDTPEAFGRLIAAEQPP